MKRYSVFLFFALFGLAQIVQAANPDDGKKGKQKAKQPAHKTQQQVRQAPAMSKKKQGTVATHNNANAHVQKSVNRQPTTVYNGVNRDVKKPIKRNNAVVATHSAAKKQPITNVAAQQNWQHQKNGKTIKSQPNSAWTTQNNRHWNNSSSLSFHEASSRWNRGHHHRDWWRSHYGTNIVLFGRGYYYWDSGYWYPAYGYDPVYSTYEYNGPIYGYNNLPPGQVVANVQRVLRQQGYYRGAIDGSIGPLTRSALRQYQRDNGLEITAAIDEPTLSSLGMI